MTILSRLAARLAKLPPPKTRQVGVEQDIKIPLPDGVVLLADRYYPNVIGAEKAPILLNRTPYGRRGERIPARLYAERGYQVVVVSCRGTFGSGGTWDPFWNEQADGHAVLAWLADQPWFSGTVGAIGASYHGLTQWAVANDPPPFLKAMAPTVTCANFRELVYPSDVYALESMLIWTGGLDTQELGFGKRFLALRRAKKRLAAATNAVPLADGDVALIDHRAQHFQDWINHDEPGDPLWASIDFRQDLERVPPAMLVAGWYDLFIASQVEDFKALQRNGRPARIKIGPWHHASPGGAASYVRETLHWMDYQLLGTRSHPSDDEAVRLFVMGSKRWMSFAEWPPPATSTKWHLQSGGVLDVEAPRPSSPDRYRYDPADPTPVLGGTSLFKDHAGPKDNRPVEARDDVLLYTSDALTADVTVIGPVTAELHVRSSLDYTDFFVRLCDVDPKGRSTNLCDGIARLHPGTLDRQADGSFAVRVELFPTANTFTSGHRIRVQVSSGAHPLYARNAGSGEPHGKATTLIAADQEVLHDPDHPSFIELPVVS